MPSEMTRTGTTTDALIDLGRNVERAALAVDDDFRLADGHLDVGAGLGDVDGFGGRIVRYRRAHLLEHRAERDKDRAAAHERGEDAALLQFSGFV